MASLRKLQQLKSCDMSDEDDCPGDYLQDPALWTDDLPQPFRMLDRLLNEVLHRSWEMIESREVERQREAAKVRIPEITEWNRVYEVDEEGREGGGVCSVLCCSEGHVFVSGSRGFTVLRAPREGGMWERVAQSGDLEMDVNKLDIVSSKGVHFCAAVCSREVKIFALIKEKLIYISSISSQSEEQVIVAGQFSPTCSHIGVTVSHPDSGVHLQIHQLPLDSWHTELSQYMDKLSAALATAAEEGQPDQVNVQEIVYSKPALLAVVHPPKAFSPCPTNDPGAAYQRMKEGMRDHMPTGEFHILTPKYFENRKKAFIAKWPQMADKYDDILATLNYSKSLPTYHFLYYMDNFRRAKPCYVAIWWEKHNFVFIYHVPTEVSKNPATATQQIYWLLPHTSTIIASAVSSDTKLLAVGQAKGVVSVYNLQTELCERVTVIAQEPDSITCLQFFGGVIGVGSEKGRVMGMATGQDRDKPAFSLGQRVKKQRDAHSSLFESSGYEIDSKVVGLRENSSMPAVLSSIHDDGSIILWSIDDREALCKLCLPLAAIHEQCFYTSDGKRLLALTSGGGSISFDLTSPSTRHLLSKHWKQEMKEDPFKDFKEDVCTGNIMEAVDRHLQQYLKQRLDDREARLARIDKYWAEFDELLKART